MQKRYFRAGLVVTLGIGMLLTTSAFATPIQTNQIADEINKDRIYKHIAKLANKDNARVTGFDGEHHAADYIQKHLKKSGIKVERQTFPIMAYLSQGSQLKVAGNDIESRPFSYSQGTDKKGITAKLATAGLGRAEDVQNQDLKGKIALIQRGEITFFEKQKQAAKAGAIGVIIYNNVEGSLNGTLGSPGDIPALGISKADGEALLTKVTTEASVKATIKADIEMNPSYSQNVIGTIKAKRGNKAKAKTIVIGAHYDGVDAPAANDNASGTSTLLEVAKALSDEKLNHNVKVIFFGAEEVGLVGSARYVNSLTPEEKGNIAAMINMDMVGVGDTMGLMTADPNATSFVADRAEDYIQTYRFPYERSSSTRSDHASFEAAGIPVAFLNWHTDPYYHSDEDTIDKINKGNIDKMGKLVTLLVRNMAVEKNLPSPGKSKVKNLGKSKFPVPGEQAK
ncbi:M20/M25/M40 family metallo-hydrolase [Marininema halotolerans]|uniref:Aminopeptidase YwaD n=1 Tax=Marininema halotolerans TaxID=1155944 RepID=A0A1I6RKV7_9BACL|nr:M20/M25/M40 family metallo-hydrolase [Marininema halotolerans]SFS65230.1 aminopeptidase YwaD [Marininema halotolerans]